MNGNCGEQLIVNARDKISMTVNDPVKLLLSFTNHTILSATPPRERGDAFFRADRPTPRLPSGASCARDSVHYILIVVLATLAIVQR